MFLKIVIGLAVVVVILVIVIASRPSQFRVVRSAAISAPPSVVFEQVNDFHKWEAWSPWARRDPNMKQIYEGSPAGTGAVYSWVGNSDVGEGRMTLIESHPGELIRLKLEFFKPFAATNATEFTFKPAGADGTAVTWTMTGRNNFLSKAMCLFVNMDRMVGGMFEQGLARMRSIVESTR